MYIEDIFNNNIKREMGIDDSYMARQPHLNFRMRTILIEWLTASNKRLPHEVIGKSVMLIDQFLEKKVVLRKNLQLLGIMALRLAIKYESRCDDLVVDKCIYLCDNAYVREECFEMEMLILNVLKYNLSSVHSYTFLTILLEYDSSLDILKKFASNVLLLLLPKRMLLKYLPSEVASAVIYVSRKELMLVPYWTKKLSTLTNYGEEVLRSCIDRIGKENLDYNAIKTKVLVEKKV